MPDDGAYSLECSVKVVQDVIVCYAQYGQIQALKEFVALLIVCSLVRFGVDWTVNLDDEPRCGAVEVRNKPTNRVLTPKLKSIKLMTP